MLCSSGSSPDPSLHHIYHQVQQLEQSFGVNWPVAVQTIGFYRYPNAPPELKIMIVEVTNPNIIVID